MPLRGANSAGDCVARGHGGDIDGGGGASGIVGRLSFIETELQTLITVTALIGEL